MYYSGHAWLKPDWTKAFRKDLVIHPTTAIQVQPGFDPDTTTFGLSYSNIIKRLDRTPGEIFHVLECCKGGGAALNSECSELMSASAANPKYSADGTPAAANYGNSFMDAIKVWRRSRQYLTEEAGEFQRMGMSASFQEELMSKTMEGMRRSRGLKFWVLLKSEEKWDFLWDLDSRVKRSKMAQLRMQVQ